MPDRNPTSTIGLSFYLVADVGVDHRLSVISRDAVHSLHVGFWPV
jgi:hypothetical protein